MAPRREWVHEGALFAYAADMREDGPLAARLLDRIFRGTKPANRARPRR
jgi:hypothetical protein